jgi:hypothetical protein
MQVPYRERSQFIQNQHTSLDSKLKYTSLHNFCEYSIWVTMEMLKQFNANTMRISMQVF